MKSPPAEIEVDEALVRALLDEQHRDLANLPLTELDAGWDNTLWRLGDELLVRLPRRQIAAPLARHEQRWLPELAARLPLPVPVPLRMGRPSSDYPWPWSVVPWLRGQPADRGLVTDPEDAAQRLGHFLRCLHQRAPASAPQNPYRGVPLAERRDIFEQRLVELAGEVEVAPVRRVWDRALAAVPWDQPAVWIHGDLHPANVLLVNGTMSAVIDFGDMCGGDPATDLAGAWMLLPAPALTAFADAYGRIDADLERRALGWAVLFAVMLLAIGLDDRPTYEGIGRATLAKAVEAPA